MKRYVLDTAALLALRDDEPGADRVAALLMRKDREFSALPVQQEVLLLKQKSPR